MSYELLLSVIKGLDKDERNVTRIEDMKQALDTILLTKPPFNPRIVILPHFAFWTAVGFNALQESDVAEEYKDAAVKELQQEAATQRVRLSMVNVEDAVLINMLRHNKQQCYEYLQQRKKEVDILPLVVFEQSPELIADDLLAKEARAQLLVRVIENIVDTATNGNDLIALRALIALDDFEAFKQQCVDDKWMKSNEWLDVACMQAIQAAACSAALTLQTQQCSSFKTHKAHSHLLNALKAHPLQECRYFLKNDGHALSLLMNTTAQERIVSEIGGKCTPEDIAHIIAENSRNERVQHIHNAALIQALASKDLSDIQIKRINKLFRAPFEKEYFADRFARITDITLNHEDINRVINLHKQNAMLHDAYAQKNGSPALKSILSVLLRQDFNGALSIDDSEALNKKINQLLDQALQKPDYDKYSFTQSLATIMHAANDSTVQKKLQNQLDTLLSAEHYERIVQQHRKKQWASYDKHLLLTTVNNAFMALKTQQNDLLKTASIMKAVLATDQNGVVFDRITEPNIDFATDLRQTETELFLIADQLQRNINALDDIIMSIPQQPDEQIKKLRAMLLAEQHQWMEQLTECQTAQTRVNTALIELERIRAKNEIYFFANRELTARAISESELQETRRNKKITSAPLTDEQIQGVTAETENKSSDIVKNSPFAKHTLYTFTESLGGTRNATGFFVQTIDREHPTNGIPVSKVELLQPPVEVGADEKGKEKIYDVPMHTKVNLYFDMALALLVAEEGRAPTKERPIYISNGTAEQQEWIWTALVLLGEQKFNFSPDALVVKGRLFSPEQVKSKSLFFAADYNNNSIYKQIHNNTEAKAALDAKLEEADKISAKFTNTNTQTTNIIKSIGHFKQEVQQIKSVLEHTQEIIGRDGIAVAHTNTRTAQ